MKYVATLFDKVREHFNVPIGINSFFRCKELNDAVGSTDSSFHLHGCAIDIDAIDSTGLTNKEIFEYIKYNCEFTELINEYNFAWVHVALVKGREKERKVKKIG